MLHPILNLLVDIQASLFILVFSLFAACTKPMMTCNSSNCWDMKCLWTASINCSLDGLGLASRLKWRQYLHSAVSSSLLRSTFVWALEAEETDVLEWESHDIERLRDFLWNPLCCLLLDRCAFGDCASSDAISELFHCMFSQSNLSSSSLPVGGSITLKAFLCSFTSMPLVRTWNLTADRITFCLGLSANWRQNINRCDEYLYPPRVCLKSNVRTKYPIIISLSYAFI